MTTSKDTLDHAVRIVRTELPKHLSREFTITDVQSEWLPGPDCEDYLHVNVILEDHHPEPDPRKLLKFNQTVRPIFERAGIVPVPTISYSNRSEITP
ncbi:MAG: hypothetical protein OXF79_17030 [Chloroflexi bacterium]|nr:hypothetical protein [Chloroflexota bacterium]